MNHQVINCLLSEILYIYISLYIFCLFPVYCFENYYPAICCYIGVIYDNKALQRIKNESTLWLIQPWYCTEFLTPAIAFPSSTSRGSWLGAWTSSRKWTPQKSWSPCCPRKSSLRTGEATWLGLVIGVWSTIYFIPIFELVPTKDYCITGRSNVISCAVGLS